MSRKGSSTGVGRGNGVGSRRTQFRDGMPSANPKGRPRKRKLRPSRSIGEAVQRKLFELVEVSDGTRQIKMLCVDFLVQSTINSFAKASMREKLALLRHLNVLGAAVEAPPHHPSDETIKSVLDELSRELELMPDEPSP